MSSEHLAAPTMVDEQELFLRVVKRLFEGSAREILGEILQNSQRAGATNVDITFPLPTRCVIQDNGTGLSGLADLDRLLRLAASHYDDERVEANQAPMGVGIYSLIANARICRVHLESNAIALSIETPRWMQDKMYRDAWPQRIERPLHGGEVQGFRLVVDGQESFIRELRTLLEQPISSCLNDARWLRESMSPARGYWGILDIRLDGSLISTALPDWVTLPDADIVAEYQGNEVRIRLDREYNPHLCVLWYGQLVAEDLPVPWRAYLVVRAGSPVTPKASTRQGLVRDEALAALVRWIEEQIFAFVCGSVLPSVEHVTLLYSVNGQRAARECPFAVVRQWQGLPFSSVKSLEDVERGELLDEVVVRKDRFIDKHVLPSQVIVLLPKGHPSLPYEYRECVPDHDGALHIVMFDLGLTSLIRATKLEAYQGVVGVEQTGVVWWKPGIPVDGFHTIDLGLWGIGGDQEEPSVWQPLIEGNVYVVDSAEAWHIGNRSWVIGVTDTGQMPQFLQTYGWAAWSSDEDNPDMSAQEYEASMDECVRSYLPETIACSTSVAHLATEAQRFLPIEQDARLAIYQLVFDESARDHATGIRIVLPDGTEKFLHLY